MKLSIAAATFVYVLSCVSSSAQGTVLKRDVIPPPPPPTATFTFTSVSTPTPLPPSASHPGGGCVSDEGVTYQCVPPGPPPTTIPVSPVTVA